ncbi:hypothetical protein J4G02_21555 [Candidatus Poribacteria bacterium]|nr:hypothetical protein [Candidatus Poribacteria bacterium]
MITVSDIAIRVVSEDDFSFAIKALVQNGSDNPRVFVELQGLDSDGFEICDAILESIIPIGASRVLTTKEDYVDKKIFEQIVGWQQK